MIRFWPLCAALLIGFVVLEGRPFKNGFDLEHLGIPREEVIGGGPNRDGIPSIDNPVFRTVAETSYLKESDLLMSVTHRGITRAYPIRILNFHEVVNDSIDDLYFAVTYCPLCGTGMVFNREIVGEVTTFGVSGLLYQSDVLLYDRASKSLWSQLKMEGVSGVRLGQALQWLPSEFMTWESWEKNYPNGEVLSTKTGARRDYRSTPYEGYEQSDGVYFSVPLYRANLENKHWVLGIVVDGVATAYDLDIFVLGRKYEDKVGDRMISVSYDKETKRAQVSFADSGQAIPHVYAFWFAWQAFYPETRLMTNRKSEAESSDF